MKILLDSHTLIWLYTGNERLSEIAKNIISDETNECFMSIATVWEMALKIKLGKMNIGVPLHRFVEDVVDNGIQILHIELAHIFNTQNLDFHHRDSFDRMLISQAIIESMNFVSSDTIADLYFANQNVNRIW
jgi:PIN domain nuclease of toxin-antitoxin system